MEELQGQIIEFIFQNDVNSYTIAVVETNEGEEITVTGYLPFINVGDTLKMFGKHIIHQEYGEQFKIETFEKLMPQTLDALERYLANGTIKGIGPSIAKRIVTTFGEDTINVFKFEPKKLAQIKGITETRAEEMSKEFVENWELWQIVGFLEKFGINVSSAKKIYKELGTSTIEEIENNPYLLVDIIQNVDFKKIDKMALDLGMSLDNTKRVKSGIKFSLGKISLNGHCCTLKQNLIKYVSDLLGVDTDRIEESLRELILKEEIEIEKRYEEEWVYLKYFYDAENNIAQKLLTLQNSKNIKKMSNFNKELEKAEKANSIELSEKQKEAIKKVNENNVTVITGGPGTGKTTIIKTLIDIYKIHGKKVVLCAPTGRAAKRITETTGEEAKTLHRLLEIGKIEDDFKNVNNNNITPIDADVIVVDEISMVDMFLMNYLLKAVYLGTKLVLVGDADQLPSVGPGNILKDIIESGTIETIHLNEIFRQAAKSKIILNAHRVNEGNQFIKSNESDDELKQDFFYINENSQEKMLYELVSLCKGRLQNYGNYNFFDNIQILTPTKKGMLGTKELNKVLQKELNPSVVGKREKKSGEIIFREGDRVMQTKNNYDLYWEKQEENGTGIFNGELGRIQKVNEEEKQIRVKFDDGKTAWYLYSDLDQLEHAYSITIHKSQGSEFDVVIIAIPPAYPMLLTRNLLYTSITRAKELLIIIGSNRTIDYMINNDNNKNRNTGLTYKLMQLGGQEGYE